MGWQSIGQGTGTHMVLRWAVGFPKTMVVRPALLLLLLFYFLNSKRIRVSDCLGNCRIHVSVSVQHSLSCALTAKYFIPSIHPAV